MYAFMHVIFSYEVLSASYLASFVAVCVPCLLPSSCAAESGDGDQAANASAKSRRAITRATREHAAMVHRSSVMCIVGRARLYDLALKDEEVQVGRGELNNCARSI